MTDLYTPWWVDADYELAWVIQCMPIPSNSSIKFDTRLFKFYKTTS
jgi:hypothetical protein